MRRMLLKELPRYECLIEASQCYPGLDPSACEVFLNLLHTVDILAEKESEYLAPYNLSQTRFVVLMFLSESDEKIKSSDVAAELAV
ncbi:MAG: hypothetical protein ABI615_14265, partial [Chthoniobacterales bacterium]